ncbi:hypothetical protein [Changpingibacter yushuensis]|uniref:hypothetical protein n=1 Tax=Changpingibacter yushuensis TaxID=2758440 RepID=UPI00165E96C5|nr:hypothetical protein [Changpingibacter yushuensis]
MGKPSAQIKQQGERLNEFRAAFIELINASRPAGGDWDLPRLVPDISNDRWSQLPSDTAIAAGAAQEAYSTNGGGTFTMRNAAYMTTVNPIANWHFAMERPDELKPQMVVSAVDLAIGQAFNRYENALQCERGLVGVIASFLRWPQTLREAVGPSWIQRTARGCPRSRRTGARRRGGRCSWNRDRLGYSRTLATLVLAIVLAYARGIFGCEMASVGSLS